MDIRLFPFPSPKDIPTKCWQGLLRKAEKETKRLTEIVERIEKTTDVTYPRIFVAPFALIHRDIDAVYFGSHNWMPDVKTHRFVPIIWLTIPALLYADDDTLACHLLHELLHYIDRVILERGDKERLYMQLIDVALKRAEEKPKYYLKPKRELRVKNLAKKWIADKALLELFLRYETEEEMRKKLGDEIRRSWIGKRLPAVDISWLDKTAIDSIKNAIDKNIVKPDAIYVDPSIARRISEAS